MSRETVYALHRLTQKLAAEKYEGIGGNASGADWRFATMGGPNMGELSPDGITRSAPVAGSRNMPGMQPVRTSADEPQGLDRVGNPYHTSPANIPEHTGRGSLDQRELMPAGVGDMVRDPADDHLTPPPDVDPQTWGQYLQSLMGNVDWSTLGGAGLGGLGAYSLARLLQSGDEDKKKFPWLSTLAGTAAGGLLLPALLNSSYAQQAGGALRDAASRAGTAVGNAVKGVTG